MPLYEFEGRRPKIDNTAWIAPSADLIGDVRVGPNCYIGWKTVIRADHATIYIEGGSAVEEGVLIHVLPAEINGSCRVGRQVTIGHGATLHNCTIEDYAVIGLGSVICNHATVGCWAIVGEMGLVKSRQKVPAEAIAVGQPVEVIGHVDEHHKSFWLAGKRLYQEYAERNDPGLKEVRLDQCLVK